MQCRIGKLMLLQKIIERAAVFIVRIVNTRQVERDGPQRLCLLENLAFRYKMNYRRRVDETKNEPGTGQSVNLRAFPGYPMHKF